MSELSPDGQKRVIGLAGIFSKAPDPSAAALHRIKHEVAVQKFAHDSFVDQEVKGALLKLPLKGQEYVISSDFSDAYNGNLSSGVMKCIKEWEQSASSSSEQLTDNTLRNQGGDQSCWNEWDNWNDTRPSEWSQQGGDRGRERYADPEAGGFSSSWQDGATSASPTLSTSAAPASSSQTEDSAAWPATWNAAKASDGSK